MFLKPDLLDTLSELLFASNLIGFLRQPTSNNQQRRCKLLQMLMLRLFLRQMHEKIEFLHLALLTIVMLSCHVEPSDSAQRL